MALKISVNRQRLVIYYSFSTELNQNQLFFQRYTTAKFQIGLPRRMISSHMALIRTDTGLVILLLGLLPKG